MNASSADAASVPQGIQPAQVTAWLTAHVPEVEPPLRFELIPGGHSNLTYRVHDAGGRRWVLRRPPLGQVLATAHDMGREHRVMSALAPTDVPVPPMIGLCEDEAVNGAPFYVMGHVAGSVLRTPQDAERFDPEQRARIGRELAEVLARIHAVDPAAVGLGDLGRNEGYLERQLRRWNRQWQQSRTRELPVVDDVHDALAVRVPEQGPAAIVHGDYRLDNCLLDDDGRIAAVLDWELCTLGDPLADAGLLLVYWAEPDDEHPALLTAPTVLPGFPSRTELVEAYARASGRHLGDIEYYVAFGYWKLACILEGVYARYKGGVMASDDGSSGFEGFADQVELLAGAAKAAVERLR